MSSSVGHEISFPSGQATPEASSLEYFRTLLQYAGNLSWYKPEPRVGPRNLGMTVLKVSGVEHPEGQAFAPGSTQPLPSWLQQPTRQPMTIRYDRRQADTSLPIEQVELTIQPPSDGAYIPNKNLAPKERGFKKATVPAICELFGKKAETFEELAEYTRVFLESVDARSRGGTRGKEDVSAAITLFQRSMAIANGKDSYGDESSNPFLAVLSSLSEGRAARKLMQERISETMVWFAVRNLLPMSPFVSYDADVDPEIKYFTSNTALFQAIKELDARGYLTSDFWIGAGVTHGLAARDSDFLELLHSKLVKPGDPQLIEGMVGSDRGSVSRRYLTSLLRVCAHESNLRHTSPLQKILDIAIPKGQNSVRPEVLVAVANSIIKSQNSTTTNPEEQHQELQSTEVGKALLLILSRTRKPGLTREQEEELAIRDLMAVDVLDALFQMPRQARHMTLVDLRAFFPGKDDDELKGIQRNLGQQGGTTLHEAAVKAYNLRKQHTEGAIDAYNVRKPGYGYLS